MSYQNLSVFSASANNFLSFPIVWAKQIMFVHHTDDVWYCEQVNKAYCMAWAAAKQITDANYIDKYLFARDYNRLGAPSIN